jgi:hypothetical protein
MCTKLHGCETADLDAAAAQVIAFAISSNASRSPKLAESQASFRSPGTVKEFAFTLFFATRFVRVQAIGRYHAASIIVYDGNVCGYRQSNGVGGEIT